MSRLIVSEQSAVTRTKSEVGGKGFLFVGPRAPARVKSAHTHLKKVWMVVQPKDSITKLRKNRGCISTSDEHLTISNQSYNKNYSIKIIPFALRYLWISFSLHCTHSKRCWGAFSLVMISLLALSLILSKRSKDLRYDIISSTYGRSFLLCLIQTPPFLA